MKLKIIAVLISIIVLIWGVVYLAMATLAWIGDNWIKITIGIGILLGCGLSWIALRNYLIRSKIKNKTMAEHAIVNNQVNPNVQEKKSKSDSRGLVSSPVTKGKMFEDYVRDSLFPLGKYELLHRTPEYRDGDYDDSLRKPDFKFRSKEDTATEFSMLKRNIGRNVNRTALRGVMKLKWVVICDLTKNILCLSL